MSAHVSSATPAPSEASVQVALRIRPIAYDAKSTTRTRQRAENEVLAVAEPSDHLSHYHYQPDSSSPPLPQRVMVVPLQRQFTFDHVFGTASSQDDIYQGSVKRMVNKFLEGYNVTIMAYGQTSSGKTYTMGTGAPTADDAGSPSQGIIPRAMAQLFQQTATPAYHGSHRLPLPKTTFRVSFIEIYNEDLIDLLVKGDFRPPVSIREDTKGNIFWVGLQEIVVSSVEEVIHTEMNEKSSRSHAIFSITLRQEKFVPSGPPPPPTSSHFSRNSAPTPTEEKTNPQLSGRRFSSMRGASPSPTPGSGPTTMSSIPFTSGIVAPGSKLKRQSTAIEAVATPASEEPEIEGEWVTFNSKFHFVDLAGSERLKRTSAIGDRAKEGISINAGLHALGNVISALGDPSKKASHVPYRDSKLTRLLQDSLGGNALALMIACVSPSELNLGETVNTLKYANRARNIKNSLSLNQEFNMDNPEYLKGIIQKLRQEIKALRENSANTRSMSPSTPTTAMALMTAPSSATLGIHTDSTTTPLSTSRIGTLQHRSSSVSISSTSGDTDTESEDHYFHNHAQLHRLNRDPSAMTDTSSHHGSTNAFLGAVQEEDDTNAYSETSSSTPTTIGGRHAHHHHAQNIQAMLGPVLESKSFQEYVEPVIEEYEKSISALESELALMQAALKHSEMMLDEKQEKIESFQQETQTLQFMQQEMLLSQKRSSYQQPLALAHHYHSNGQQSLSAPISTLVTAGPSQDDQHLELKEALDELQEQLVKVERARDQNELYIGELEKELQREKAEAEAKIQELRRRIDKSSTEATAMPPKSTKTLISETVAATALYSAQQDRTLEMNTLLTKIESLEQQQQDAEAALKASQHIVSELQASQNGDNHAVGRDSDSMHDDRKEEELIELVQVRAALEEELAFEKSRYDGLLADFEAFKAAHNLATTAVAAAAVSPTATTKEGQVLVSFLGGKQAPVEDHSILDSIIDDLSEPDSDSQQTQAKLSTKQQELQKELEVRDHRIQILEQQIVSAQEARISTDADLASLRQQLEMVQGKYKAAMDMEEMLHLAVSDLEGRLTASQASETAKQASLDEKLDRIAALETRSLKAEQDLIQTLEEVQRRVENAKTAAEERLAEELLDLLEKVDNERTKVEALQGLVDSQVSELEKEKSKTVAFQLERVALEIQVSESKEQIQALTKQIEVQATLASEKAQRIRELEERTREYEGSHESKALLIHELELQLKEQTATLGTKIDLIQDLEQKVRDQQEDLENVETSNALVSTVQAQLTTALEELATHKAKIAEHETLAETLNAKLREAEQSSTDKDQQLARESKVKEIALEELVTRLKIAESSRDEAEERLEETVRRHQVIEESMTTLQAEKDKQVEMIESLQVKLVDVQSVSPPPSRPTSVSSSMATLTASHSTEESGQVVARLEKDKARYRALVRENEREIQRLGSELDSLATEFSDAATAFEEAEEELKAKISDLEARLEGKLTNEGEITREQGTTSAMSLSNSNHSTSSLVSLTQRLKESSVAKARLEVMKVERDQALQSSEELSQIVAELNEKNHKLQERLLVLEREQESIKLQHELEKQEQADEVRTLRDRIERIDIGAGVGPGATGVGAKSSPILGSSAMDGRSSPMERVLRHKSSDSSETFVQGDESTRKSWSTVNSQPGSQVRAGRHESTLIIQAKQIKQLEEKIAEMENSHNKQDNLVSALGVAEPITVASISEDTVTTPVATGRLSFDKMSPVTKAMLAFNGASAPPTPPPSMPLPATPKDAPASPKVQSALVLNTNTSNVTTTRQPSRTGSSSFRAPRDEATSPTGSTISVATATALQGIDGDELRGVVDTLAHQVQALKVEQTMQLAKIRTLETALVQANDMLNSTKSDQEALLASKSAISDELESTKEALQVLQTKADTQKKALENYLEREKRDQERAAQLRAQNEAKMEELMSKRSKFCF